MRFRAVFAHAAPLLLLLALSARVAGAGESRTYVTPFGGLTRFDPHLAEYLGVPDSGFKAKNQWNAGARIGHVWGSGLGLEIAGGYSPTTFESSIASNEPDAKFYFVTGNLIYSPQIAKIGGPFLSAGGGGARLNAEGVVGDAIVNTGLGDKSGSGANFNHGVLDVAAGWWLRMSDRVGLRLEARNLLWIPRHHIEGAKLNYWIFGAGLQLSFGGGKPRDTDGDGVPDDKDKCPDTPAGATVDATGCPHDADGDGVLDGLDKCPGTPKGSSVDAGGCPKDSDGDGVVDGLDKCPDTPAGATVDASGCPKDSDGDGVMDGLDKCPDTPRGATVDATGCTHDSDGDGVVDGLDKCADTPAGAKVDKDGCPIEVTEKETELLDTGMIRLQNVNFETAKADVLPESFPTLDIAGQVLTKWPELKLEIGGHTDARGSNVYNQKLSESRAKAVLDYLLAKFPTLKAEQFTVKGYGESKPIAPNTSQLNMAKNRRVEFVVQNKDVLKREREKRRLLQKGDAAPADTTKR